MQGKIRIERTRDGEYYFCLVSEDEKDCATSECFETLSACRNGIRAACDNIKVSVTTGGVYPTIDGSGFYEIFENKGKYTFLLKGTYGEVLLFGGEMESEDECLDTVSILRSTSFAEVIQKN